MTVTAPLGHTSCGRTGRPGARPVRGRFGAWRALAALPAIFGGTAVMFVLTAAWAPLLFVLWLGCAGLWSTPLGERLAVRTALGFRPLPAGRRELIEGVCAAALARCGLPVGSVDFYVKAGRQPNACATGRRSVAVTDGAVESFLAGRLPADLFGAVLVHELGHHATRAGRFALAALWLAGPGRVAFRAVLAVTLLLCGRRRLGRPTWLVIAVGGGVAIVQAAQQQQWLTVAGVSAIAFALAVTPVLDGAVSRASEHAADRYTASVGAGPDLARALVLISGSVADRRGLARRALDRHPSLPSRLDRLGRLNAGSAVPVGVLPT
ncbi:MAG: M48 family metalloprotease [Actinobacteria bacterium]|nr:M48 family metalloprotease [Actinomycetota bacterium]